MRGRAWIPLVFVCLLAGCAKPRPPFVLLLTIDTLRADHVGAFGGTAGLTPHIDALARESVVFRNAYSPASFTLPAVAALMTSRYPDELGVRENGGRLSPAAMPLAVWLSKQGFATSAVVSNYVLRRHHGLDAGFASYDAEFPQREATRPVPERVGSDTTVAALAAADALRATGRPALLWVHYQDPHGPYTPPPPYRRDPGADGEVLPVSTSQSGRGAIPRYQYVDGRHDVGGYRDAYRGEVAYVDASVGALLDGLRQRRLLEGAVVVLAADHGEELGEGGFYFTHGENLSDCLLHVPLLVRVPGREARTTTQLATLLDVLPTLAAVLGVQPPSGTRGRDLLAGAGASGLFVSSLQAAPPRHGLVTSGHRYVAHEDGSQESLFELGTEGPDLAARQPELVKKLRGQLVAARRALVTLPGAKRELTDEERESFKALGYVDGGR
jgi:arylsulfatase A-like enzyme